MLGFPDSELCPVDFGGARILPKPPLRTQTIHITRDASEAHRIRVSKATHCIRFENETESSVDVVIEPKAETARQE